MMKIILGAGLLPALALALVLCFSCRSEAAGKTLVAYFSWSGNTEALAKIIQEETGADIFRIETVEPYPEEYNATTDQAREEIRSGARPALKTAQVPNLADYDTVFIGLPNWWSTIPAPVATFLEANDFSGKTIAEFVTHGGGGEARCSADLQKLCAGAKFTDTFVVGGSRAARSRDDVKRWLTETGLAK